VEVIVMKKIILCVMLTVMLTGPGAVRADDKDVFWGALLGAGAGLLIGETVDGVHSSVAVPIGAIAGGLIGSELERASRRGCSTYATPHGYRYPRARGYGHYGWHPAAAPCRVVRAVEPKQEKPGAPPIEDPNYHPGVEVVKVEITLVTGAPMDVRLLRMPDGTFVGPQGEKYETLPKVADLARYTGVPALAP
jgi:hypothetical protein